MDVDVDACAEEEVPPPPEVRGWENPRRKMRAKTSKKICGLGCECEPKIGLGNIPYYSPLMFVRGRNFPVCDRKRDDGHGRGKCGR